MSRRKESSSASILVVGDDGVAEAVYPVLEPSRGLMSARRTGSGWDTEPIDTGNIWQPAAALDSDGDLHVTYYEAEDGALRHAERADGGWTVETIADDSSPTVRIGRQSSLAIYKDGGLHVAYYIGDASSGTTVRYAKSRLKTVGTRATCRGCPSVAAIASAHDRRPLRLISVEINPASSSCRTMSIHPSPSTSTSCRWSSSRPSPTTTGWRK